MEIKDVIVSQFAEDDLNEIVEHYFSLSSNYVKNIISEFEINILSLQTYPKRRRIVPELDRQSISQMEAPSNPRFKSDICFGAANRRE